MEITETCRRQGVLDGAQEQRPGRFYLPPTEHQEETWKATAAAGEGLSPSLSRQHSQGAQTGGEAQQQQLCQLKETSGSGEFPHVFPMCFLCILLLICHADQKRWRDSNYFTQNLNTPGWLQPRSLSFFT